MVESLLSEFGRLAGLTVPSPEHAEAHFWKYAKPSDETLSHNLVDVDSKVVVAGDAFRGGRIEGAWLSGRDAAGELLRLLRV